MSNLIDDNTLQIIQKISKRLSSKYVFGYLDREDVEQEAIIIGIKALEKYDASKGSSLETFLYTHINNRLKTFKRDNHFRIPKECSICGGKNPHCTNCDKINKRLNTRKNLMSPQYLDETNQEYTYQEDFSIVLERMETASIIDQYLDISLRLDYLKMLSGVYVPKIRREKIEEEIIRIITEYESRQSKKRSVES